MTYVLHYAPDNASLIIRLALDTLGRPFEARLVDRSVQAQKSAAYRALNPAGLIPVLETPDGPVFETAAILIWLVDRHGLIGPQAGTPRRAAWLKWLLQVANTVHPLLQQTFYPYKFIGDDQGMQAALRRGVQPRMREALLRLEAEAQSGTAFDPQAPGALEFYVAACLRWRAIYPAQSDTSWFTFDEAPALYDLCARVEALPACAALIHAEGLGPHPFTAPQLPTPPEGSAV